MTEVFLFLRSILMCFGASLSFAVLLNAPQRVLISSSIAAMSGYGIYMAVNGIIQNTVFSTAAACVISTILCDLLSRKYKMPVTVFLSVAIIPFVPGLTLYRAMTQLVEQNYALFMSYAGNTLSTLGAIAISVGATSLILKRFFPRKAGINSDKKEVKVVLKHFTATAVVFNEQGNFLMVKHKKLGVWLCPGGHVEPNELPDDAALREVLEETGIEAEFLDNGEMWEIGDDSACSLHAPLCILREDIGHAHNHYHIDLVYAMKGVHGKLSMNKSENTEVKWFKIDQLSNIETYKNVRCVVKAAHEKYYAQANLNNKT